ncbi:MAG: hypothetical protein JNL42_10770 [Anaerolineae bacterium]|nr:hypothetical protein [Anaerolineae bacterium]
MNDAQALFREGVLALKEQRDVARARQLITQSLKLDPNNEMAWLWLSRTTDDPARKLQCVERALKINPANDQALALRAKLTGGGMLSASAPESAPPKQSSVHDRLEHASLVHHDAPPPPAAPPIPAARAPLFMQPEPEADDVQDAPPGFEALRDLVPEEAIETVRGVKTQNDRLTPEEERQIEKYLAAAEARLAAEDEEAAVEQYVYALQIQVDHPQVMQRAVRLLHQMKYTEDAQELLDRAIEAGTPSLAIHLTAIDVNRMLGNYSKADALREKVVQMDAIDDAGILKIIDSLLNDVQGARAIELLEKALVKRPNSHDLLMKMADILEDQGRKVQAMGYYERAARAGKRGNRKQADRVLQTFTPVITDHERGSVVLALREAAGFTAAYLFMAWQDSGLNLLRMSPGHWLGVGLSLVGGYCVVTAFSSPQQKGLAALFGGQVPAEPEGGKHTQQVEVKPWEEDIAMPSGPLQDPTSLPILPGWARMIFALIGIALLGVAFYLVFNRAIPLLLNPVEPEIPSVLEFIGEG